MAVRLSVLSCALFIGMVPMSLAAATSPTPVVVSTDSAEKLVCKRTMRTGTRFVGKVCRTEARWEEIREGSRRSIKELADRPFIFDCRTAGQGVEC